MTMPHLMNCNHSDEGWCLECVKQMHDELEAEADKWKAWNGPGRRVAKDGRVLGDAWNETVTWHGCDTQPVHGYLCLAYVPDGEEPDDTMGWQHRFQVFVCDFRGCNFDQVKAGLNEIGARWWAYIPDGPPANIHPVPWEWGDDEQPIIREADDPPASEWKRVMNVPATYRDFRK